MSSVGSREIGVDLWSTSRRSWKKSRWRQGSSPVEEIQMEAGVDLGIKICHLVRLPII
ncbi:hypothetical protein TIFTF001_021981 [Ficus carica]|uniref:Uncharacterized protein n=1 Tax=Ficus carica TaxID=3494 RepID=A0AA88ALA9_FICCA|nr:hypothetical protein TIFTF001_021981 [Ficus carica]